MELINGRDLYSLIDSLKGGMDEITAKKLLMQLCLTVRACHLNGVVHRDIKLENILIDDDLHLYLCDFGLATFITDTLLDDYCGSTAYTAPEVLQNTPYDGRQSDVWSIGVVMYAMLMGYLLFCDDDGNSCGSLEDSERALRIKVLEGVYQPLTASEEAIHLLHHLLCPVQGRMKLNQVLSHPWLNSVTVNLRKLSNVDVIIKLLIDAGFDEATIHNCLLGNIPDALFGLIHTLAYKRLEYPQ